MPGDYGRGKPPFQAPAISQFAGMSAINPALCEVVAGRPNRGVGVQYRKDIDGLRAVAVIPVILFHAGLASFGGGFAGVDVFFVLSGYLITSLIVLERQAGRFSLADFYERRVRRILPALYVMVAMSLLCGVLIMLPGQLVLLAKSAIAVCLFASNFFFFMRTQYFSVNVQTMPLVHSWTLAVEEQFYLIFPIFIAMIWSLGRRRVTVAVALIAFLSFVLCHLFGNFTTAFPFLMPGWKFSISGTGFFLTPARAWELMLGSLAGLCRPGGTLRHGLAAEIGAAVGLAAILLSIFLYGPQTPFPSLYTLLPAVGTLLVLLCATPRSWTGRLLAVPPLVGVGLVSYSAYLWHQPLFAFWRLSGAHLPAHLDVLLLSLGSLAIGYLSWRFVERPFRDRERFSQRQIFAFAVAGGTVLAAISFGLVLSDGLLWRYPERDRFLLAVTPDLERTYVNARFNALAKDFDGTRDKKLLVVGDSYAQDLVNMIFENQALPGYQIRTFYIPASCQIVVQDDPPPTCRRQSPLNPVLISRARQADVIVLAASWQPGAAARIMQTLRKMGLDTGKRLFILGAKSFGDIDPASYLPLSRQARLALRNRAPHRVENDILEAVLPKGMYIDVERQVCEHDICPVFTPDEGLISFDGWHLTPYGAKFIGKKLFTLTPLKSLIPAQ